MPARRIGEDEHAELVRPSKTTRGRSQIVPPVEIVGDSRDRHHGAKESDHVSSSFSF
jgi:hypothetical protein